MDWKRYYVGVSKNPMRLFIGTGDIKKDGTIRYTNKSDDRSFEIINAVGKYMRIKRVIEAQRKRRISLVMIYRGAENLC